MGSLRESTWEVLLTFSVLLIYCRGIIQVSSDLMADIHRRQNLQRAPSWPSLMPESRRWRVSPRHRRIVPATRQWTVMTMRMKRTMMPRKDRQTLKGRKGRWKGKSEEGQRNERWMWTTNRGRRIPLMPRYHRIHIQYQRMRNSNRRTISHKTSISKHQKQGKPPKTRHEASNHWSVVFFDGRARRINREHARDQ